MELAAVLLRLTSRLGHHLSLPALPPLVRSCHLQRSPNHLQNRNLNTHLVPSRLGLDRDLGLVQLRQCLLATRIASLCRVGYLAKRTRLLLFVVDSPRAYVYSINRLHTTSSNSHGVL